VADPWRSILRPVFDSVGRTPSSPDAIAASSCSNSTVPRRPHHNLPRKMQKRKSPKFVFGDSDLALSLSVLEPRAIFAVHLSILCAFYQCVSPPGRLYIMIHHKIETGESGPRGEGGSMGQVWVDLSATTHSLVGRSAIIWVTLSGRLYLCVELANCPDRHGTDGRSGFAL